MSEDPKSLEWTRNHRSMKAGKIGCHLQWVPLSTCLPLFHPFPKPASPCQSHPAHSQGTTLHNCSKLCRPTISIMKRNAVAGSALCLVQVINNSSSRLSDHLGPLCMSVADHDMLTSQLLICRMRRSRCRGHGLLTG